MAEMSNRMWIWTSAGMLGLLLLAVGSLSGCDNGGAASSGTLAFALPDRGGPEHGQPGDRGFSRFGERNGFSFGAHGIPGGHGFRGHGGPGKVCGGSGGSKGGGGSGGHGGVGGMSGGVGGAGGMGGTPPMVCSGKPPASALITDFSDAVVEASGSGIAFGTAPGLGGGTFTYAATGLTAPVLSLAPAPAGSSGQALEVMANPGLTSDPSNDFSGFGLGFDMCVDASAYTGVQFTITGSLGNCSLTFATQFSEDNSVTDDPSSGSCTLGGNCFPPSSNPIGTGTTLVHFTDVFGGSPLTVVDTHALTGVQWNLSGATDGVNVCAANFAVTDITFVNDAGGGSGMSGGTGGPGGGPPPAACTGSAPSTALITGSTASPVGGTFTFAAPGLTPPTVASTIGTDGSLQSLQVTATPGTSVDPFNAFSGFGLFFSAPACLNASAFDAVEFTVTGDLGTCSLNAFLVPSEDNAVANGPFGSCTAASCVSPFSMPLGTGTHTVLFSDLAGGTPDATLDAKALNDVGWTLNVPTDGVTAPCAASFTISAVSFVNE